MLEGTEPVLRSFKFEHREHAEFTVCESQTFHDASDEFKVNAKYTRQMHTTFESFKQKAPTWP